MFIDIHGHCYIRPCAPNPLTGAPYICTVEQLLARHNAIGIEASVLLPVCTVENVITPQSNEEILEISRQYPGRFIPFCNIDPRAFYNSPFAPLTDIALYYKSLGCKGLGEVTANLPILDPRVQNLFTAAQTADFPLTFHLAPKAGGLYGLIDDAGLPGLERSLQAFPQLKFLGHSQTFWCEINAANSWDDRFGYPKGRIQEGAIPRLMRTYPNLYGDLSAGSGYNALARDPEYAVRFLNEFQDRLLFGTDICHPQTPTHLVTLLQKMRAENRISETVFQKIARENAIRILHLKPAN